jgi:16S rRNA processing protein RimM
VRIGRLGRTHGVQGEMYLDGVSLTPLELHRVKHFVWRRGGAPERSLTLLTARPALTRMLVRFEGVTVREQAAELTNGELWAPRALLPDPGPGTAYTFQLIGLRVETAEGRALGTIESVISAGAQPVYLVQGERELLVPGAPGVVRRVDFEAGLMVVDLPPGLEDL